MRGNAVVPFGSFLAWTLYQILKNAALVEKPGFGERVQASPAILFSVKQGKSRVPIRSLTVPLRLFFLLMHFPTRDF